MRLLFIIPTYNEIHNIEIIIPQLLSHISNAHILVVDDSSPDGTADKVKELQHQYRDKIHLIVQDKKGGLKKAYITGFHWALKYKYEWIFEMDADLSHTPADAKNILSNCLKHHLDVCIGSRFIKGGKLVNWPFSRKLLSYSALIYIKLITGMPFFDPTTGFICYHAKYLSSIRLDRIRSSGYGFQVEMKYIAWKFGFNIKEVPITFENRKYGSSKMSSDIILDAIKSVLALHWKYLSGNLANYYKK